MALGKLTRALVLSCVVAGAFACAAPAFAQEGGEKAAESPSESSGEAPTEGIVNWWSWDYGAKAKDPSHRDWPPPFGFAIINFIVFAGIMYKACKKPVIGYLRERHETIRHDLDEAARLRGEAEQKLIEYQRKVQNVDAEIESLLAGIRKEAEAEKGRIVAAAEEQAKRLKADAERQIASEIARAKMDLQRGAIEAAVSAATKLVQGAIGADDQRKMAERYVGDLEKSVQPKRASS